MLSRTSDFVHTNRGGNSMIGRTHTASRQLQSQTRAFSLDGFLALPVPRLFLWGDANRHLSYLPLLRRNDMQVVEVPDRCHFLP
jgi:hypothetical protein